MAVDFEVTRAPRYDQPVGAFFTQGSHGMRNLCPALSPHNDNVKCWSFVVERGHQNREPRKGNLEHNTNHGRF